MNIFQNRLARIEKNHQENLDNQTRYEQLLRTTRDPLERDNYLAQVQFYGQRCEELEREWEEVNQKALLFGNGPSVSVVAPGRDPLEEQYDEIVDLLGRGQVVPVLGADISLCDREPGFKWTPEEANPASLDELASYLAFNFKYPDTSHQVYLTQVSQYASVMRSPGHLYDRLRQHFSRDYAPTTAHQFFARLPRLLRDRMSQPRYPIIITTTYDNMLEAAFDAAHEPYDVLSYVSEGENQHKFIHLPPGGNEWIAINDPSRYREVHPEQRPVILRLYGVLDRFNTGQNNLVITEDDFINYPSDNEFSQLIPANLIADLQRLSLLFLGCDLEDWNSRMVLRRLWKQRRNAYDSWAIEDDPKELNMLTWQKLGVKVVTADLLAYITGLQDRLKALPVLEGSSV